MPLALLPYTADRVPDVRQFNQRLLAGGASDGLLFRESVVSDPAAQSEACGLRSEYFLALEGRVVRGAYALKHQDFCFEGITVRSVGYYHHAVSEGIVNKSHAPVGALLIRDAVCRQPLLYALGMDGYDKPLPKMLALLGWADCLIPFYFRVVHPRRFLTNLEALRRSRWRRVFAHLAVLSGVGWIGIKTLQQAKRAREPQLERFSVDSVGGFGTWADPIWEQARSAYAMTAVRDSRTLKLIYPPGYTHLTRLRISRGGAAIGWVVIGERQKNPRYGAMRVGSIVDCFASPQDALPVIRAATQTLEERGVDLIVSNQSHPAWCSALSHSGFLRGPSNFIFAASKNLAQLLFPFEIKKKQIHFNRADGDGLPHNF